MEGLFMRLRHWAIGFIMLSLLLNGCESSSNETHPASLSVQNDKQSHASPYLSLTATDKMGHNHYYIYQIQDRSIKEMAVLEDTAQYPLGVVDLDKNVIFYAQREAGADQLFEYNLNTKQSRKLTSDLFAINYMIPVEDQVLLAAASKEKSSVQIYSFDLQKNKLVPWFDSADDDTSVQTMTLDRSEKFLYVTLFSASEKRMNMKAAEKAQANDVVPAKHRIAKYDLRGTLLNEVLSSREKIVETAISPDDKSIILNSSELVFKPRVFALMDLNTKQKQPLKIDGISSIGTVYYSPDNKGIYSPACQRKRPKMRILQQKPVLQIRCITMNLKRRK
jgi:Tol biopolymer transport system component